MSVWSFLSVGLLGRLNLRRNWGQLSQMPVSGSVISRQCVMFSEVKRLLNVIGLDSVQCPDVSVSHSRGPLYIDWGVFHLFGWSAYFMVLAVVMPLRPVRILYSSHASIMLFSSSRCAV